MRRVRCQRVSDLLPQPCSTAGGAGRAGAGPRRSRVANDFGVYRGLAATDPQFLYVLTHGKDGSPPARKSVFFRSSDLSVFRSGWGDGAAYLKSTYLTFNIGRYRTQHSTLDALAVTLYGDGGDLIPDTGLYTYTPGVYRNYFTELSRRILSWWTADPRQGWRCGCGQARAAGWRHLSVGRQCAL